MKSRKVRKAGIAKAIMAKKKATIAIESDSDADVDDSIYENANEHIDDKLSTDDELIQHDAEMSEEEEVIPITDDEDESDVSELNEEDNLPNREAWGKKKSQYYSADFVDQDRGKTYREKDAEKAQAELEEALAIQRSVSKYMNVCLTEELQLKMTDETPTLEKDEADIDVLTKDKKLKLLKKKYPEVLIYKKEMLKTMDELRNRMIPLVEYSKNGKVLSTDWVNYIYQRHEVLAYYCLNMSYYFVLKSRGNVLQNHPVFQRVKEFEELLIRLDSITETIRDDLDHILKELRQSDILDLAKKETKKKSVSPQEEVLDFQIQEPIHKSKKDKKSKVSFETPHEKEVAAFYEDVRRQTTVESELGDENLAVVEGPTVNGEKRTITYEIAKNKGLVAKRQKEKRNPRVHHRMKFKKAQIRRKGQVRNVIKEIKRYDGEPTGISKNVVKSIKFK